MDPDVRYVTTQDGVRIAYTLAGSGSPHVLSPGVMTSHVQLEWSHPVMSQLLGELARHNTLIRFDPRGSGLSDRVLPETLDDYLRDIEAIVERTGLRRFGLTGLQLSSPATIAFAARRPTPPRPAPPSYPYTQKETLPWKSSKPSAPSPPSASSRTSPSRPTLPGASSRPPGSQQRSERRPLHTVAIAGHEHMRRLW